MAYNDNTYNLSKIFQYEDITRQYCISEGGVELPTQELIQLAAKEDEFDFDYAQYVIFKRLHQIEDYITQKTKNKGVVICNIKESYRIEDDLLKNEEYYENCVNFYENNSFYDEPDIYDIINQAIRDKNWNILYYIYYKEESELNSLLAKEEDEFNERKYEEKQKNRKFFIIQ